MNWGGFSPGASRFIGTFNATRVGGDGGAGESVVLIFGIVSGTADFAEVAHPASRTVRTTTIGAEIIRVPRPIANWIPPSLLSLYLMRQNVEWPRGRKGRHRIVAFVDPS
ncbi:hypothetical protein GOALK_108_00040 [Gordonia alkanivorans NBRC 16433]|uniref:Uncharacterized protein n=1 Tax=Gordonia alkanivorans NBRC 16433 TaxID=1027371 RepID=F9W0V3_9ACTN|nr:hypothetical protein GOALK_108_00040 [Gordonia alkanivorans NBRC 16433]